MKGPTSAGSISRRSVLGVIGASVFGVVSGCTALRGPQEVVITNDRTEVVRAAITLTTNEGGTVQLSESVELDPEEERQWQLRLENIPHTFSVDLKGDVEQSFNWTPGGEYCCVRADISSTGITITGIAN